MWVEDETLTVSEGAQGQNNIKVAHFNLHIWTAVDHISWVLCIRFTTYQVSEPAHGSEQEALYGSPQRWLVGHDAGQHHRSMWK